MERKNWADFKNTGLFTYINQFLHIFNWSIVVELNEKDQVLDVFPVKVKWEGFNTDDMTDAHSKVQQLIKTEFYDQGQSADNTG